MENIYSVVRVAYQCMRSYHWVLSGSILLRSYIPERFFIVYFFFKWFTGTLMNFEVFCIHTFITFDMIYWIEMSSIFSMKFRNFCTLVNSSNLLDRVLYQLKIWAVFLENLSFYFISRLWICFRSFKLRVGTYMYVGTTTKYKLSMYKYFYPFKNLRRSFILQANFFPAIVILTI